MKIGDYILSQIVDNKAKRPNKDVARLLQAVHAARLDRRQADTRSSAQRVFDAGVCPKPSPKRPRYKKSALKDPFSPGQNAAMRRIEIDIDYIVDVDSLEECAPIRNRKKPCFNAGSAGCIDIEDSNFQQDVDCTCGTIEFIG